MFTRFKKSYKTIFLDPSSKNINIDEKVNILLSPSLYWVKKVSLPVKYTREVMRLLPSIFEDILPDGHYSYFAYKDANDYIVFAYEDKLILDTMAEKKIELSKVANIYFAQSELENLEGAYKINESQSIYVKDGIVVLVPCCWVQESSELDLSAIKLSKNSIVLKQFNHIIEISSLYKIAGVFIFITLLIAIEWFITYEKTEHILDEKESLYSKYHLKQTTMQNEFIFNKYEKIYKKQTKLRDFLSEILKLHILNSENISNIRYKNNKLTVFISNIKNASDIKRQLKKEHIPFNSYMKKSELILEFSL